jgi:hypothetical protein
MKNDISSAPFGSYGTKSQQLQQLVCLFAHAAEAAAHVSPGSRSGCGIKGKENIWAWIFGFLRWQRTTTFNKLFVCLLSGFWVFVDLFVCLFGGVSQAGEIRTLHAAGTVRH